MDIERAETSARIEPRTILRILWIITAIILSLGYLREIIGALQGVPREKILFNQIALDRENSLPTWWATILLAIAGSSMLLTGMLERGQLASTWRGWRWLGIGFLYASLDEAASLHEHFGRLLMGLQTGGLLTYSWVIVGLAIVAVVGALFLPFLLRLPRRTAWRLVIAGAIFLGGAIGVEMFGGAVSQSADTGFAFQALFMLEETLEMLGVILGIRAVLLHIDQELGSPSFRIGGAA